MFAFALVFGGKGLDGLQGRVVPYTAVFEIDHDAVGILFGGEEGFEAGD